MPSIQQSRSGFAQTLLLATTLLFTLMLALLPATSLAHPGHLHGTLGFDGRVPGQPDFKRTGDITMRYIPSIGQYEVRSPGAPLGYIHAEAGSKGEELLTAPGGPIAASEEPREFIGPGVDLPTLEDPPICRSTGNRIVVLNVTGNPGHDAGIRLLVQRMNWKIASQSSQSSGGARVVQMAVDCQPDGQIAVHQFSGGSWSAIQNAAGRSLPGGSGVNAVKFLAFAPDNGSLYGEGGPVYPDLTKSRQNANAVNTGTAIIYNGLSSWFRHVTIHELMHAMGASQGRDVNPLAPYSDFSNHCYDGQDALCYAAAGDAYCSTAGGYGTPTTVPIDCNKNTYFNAAPPGGSWLASYWNIASVENPFLAALPTQAPLATTERATPWNLTGASFEGTVTPRADYAFYQFQYTTESAYQRNGWGSASITAKQPVAVSGIAAYGSTSANVREIVASGLQVGTDYRARVVASNDANQAAYGAELRFRTLTEPTVTIDQPEFGQRWNATLRGTINPNGVQTSYRFADLYSFRSRQYVTYRVVGSVGSGTAPVSVSAPITGLLTPSTRYSVRLYATGQTTRFAEGTFTTPDWLVDSDLNQDGRADLVTLRPDGRVSVYPGGLGTSELEFGASIDSFTGTSSLAPAQYVGDGDYVVDVADVHGDQTADLVTVKSNGQVINYRGQNGGFVFPATGKADLGQPPALLKSGGELPIAAGDVDGDGDADLLTVDDGPGNLMLYRSDYTGIFRAGTIAASGVSSAHHTGGGEYFLDLADVTGDGREDLVSMTTWDDVWVRPGKADGSLEAPIGSFYAVGAIDTALDDGQGREPVGVGDVTGDGKADLVLSEAGTVYTYPALSGGDLGRFGAPRLSGGTATSTTFQSGGTCEFFGLIDVNGDERVDLGCAVHSIDRVVMAPGKADGTFGSSVLSSGTFPSTQHFSDQDASGNEFVIEKPAVRRRGCPASGCTTPAFASNAPAIGTIGGDGGVSLYMQDTNGDVTQRWWTQSTGWSGLGWHGSPPGGVATSEPTVARPSPGSTHVFVRGSDQAIWEKIWDSGSQTWSSWTSLGGSMRGVSAPAAISAQSDEMQVFATAADDSVWRRTWTSRSGWASWEAVPNTTATGLALASRPGSAGIDLYMRDSNGDVSQRWWTQSTGWSGLGWHGRPPGGPITSTPAAVSPTSDSIHIFVRGADHALWEKVWTDASGRWSEWTSLGGVLRSGPAATSPSSGEVHVFARFANDSLFRKRWSAAAGWSRWEPVY
jgi:FG-GAP-like repeat